MKRSQINSAIAQSIETAKKYGVGLPIWADWNPQKFSELNRQEEAVKAGLGWIVVDFGKGQFAKCGLTILVLSAPTADASGEPITDESALGYPARAFSRKLLFVSKGQSEPHHFHRQKREKEVTLLAGGPVEFEFALTKNDGTLSDSEVVVRVDGVSHKIKPNAKFELLTGQTISLPAGLSHIFGATGSHAILLETSTSNNDKTDNFFPIDKVSGNPIEEDEQPKYQLVNEHLVAVGSR